MDPAFDCSDYAQKLRDIVTHSLPGTEVGEDLTERISALTFVHPAHEATVLLVVEADHDLNPMPTVLIAVVIGDWQDLQQKDTVAQMFALNPQLMTCAVGLMPINDDELAVVLSRRMPAQQMDASEIVGLIDDIIWDYARCSGWLQANSLQTAPLASSIEMPPRPKLIGSLDEA